jgi:8-oxo-dGTP diphosphatase
MEGIGGGKVEISIAKSILNRLGGPMLKYTLGLIRREDEVLLLNRNAAAWMGAWNGVGGKLDAGESPRAGMIREISEETGLTMHELSYKGIVTWKVDNQSVQGMYVYTGVLSEEENLLTPVATAEGILDWKAIDWVQHRDNVGVAYYLPRSLSTVFDDPQCYEHRCYYQQGRLVLHEIVPIVTDSEKDPDLIHQIVSYYKGVNI